MPLRISRTARDVGDARPDFTLPLQLAAGTLLLGAAIYLDMQRVWLRG